MVPFKSIYWSSQLQHQQADALGWSRDSSSSPCELSRTFRLHLDHLGCRPLGLFAELRSDALGQAIVVLGLVQTCLRLLKEFVIVLAHTSVIVLECHDEHITYRALNELT